VAFSAVLLLAPQTYWPALAALSLAKLSAVAAVMTHLLTTVVRGRPVVYWSRELRIAALLFAWAAVTIPLAVWPGGAFNTLQDPFLKSLIIFWTLGEVVVSVFRLRQIYWSLVLFTLPLPVSVILKFRSGEFLAGSSGVPRISGFDAPLTNNPNDLALMLNLVLPLTIALLSTTKRFLLRVFLLAAASLAALGVLLTFSRGGFITLSAIVAIYGIRMLRRPGRAKVLLILAVGLLCLGFMPDTYWTRVGTILNLDADVTNSAQDRRTQILAAIAYSVRHPLVGAGIGQNVVALVDSGGAWHTVHNVWLQYSADLGLPGLVLFGLLFISSIRTARSVRLASRGRPDLSTLGTLAEGLELSLIAFGVATFFHPIAYNFNFYYLAGLAISVGRIARFAPTTDTTRVTKGEQVQKRAAPVTSVKDAR
jgi:hypothetical protein